METTKRESFPATDIKLHSKFSATSGRYVELTHARTYYELQGPADGTPIVFVHGLNIYSFCWDDYVEGLLKTGKYRTLAYDLYVRGNSGIPKEVASVDLCVHQLLELIDFAFGSSTKVIICGISQGGAICASFATKHSDRVLKAALYCPAGAGANIPASLSMMQSIPYLGTMIWYSIGQRVLEYRLNHNRFKDLVFRYNEVPTSKIDYIVDRVRWLYTEKPNFFWPYYYILSTWDFFNLHKSWNIPSTVPTLILWGDKDAVCPISGLEPIKGVLSHAQVKLFENCGHGIPLEEAAQSFAALLGFLETKH